ncbi:MAG: RNA-binding protein [Firmicutes bacterium HGW-Firmicutes-7]|nr:MAG: RNA-binding protein [Firmicutes bacterium HGW-Firmicutes-7]
MRELVEVIAKALVDHPDEVSVRQVDSDQADTVVLELKVSPDDMGKVIGKQGRIAKALRTVVKASAIRDGKKVIIEIQ